MVRAEILPSFIYKYVTIKPVDGGRKLFIVDLLHQLTATPFENEFAAEVSREAFLSSSLLTHWEAEGCDEISTQHVVKSEQWPCS